MRPVHHEALPYGSGANRPGEPLYKDELKQWTDSDDIDLHVTVDSDDEQWQGLVGFVPTVLKDVAHAPRMLKFTMPVLLWLKFDPARIYTSLERRMSCGVGKCGRCNVGSRHICKERLAGGHLKC